MFPSSHLHQEIARHQHAAMLREARLHRLAELTREERERSPVSRARRLLAASRAALLDRGTARVPRTAAGPAA